MINNGVTQDKGGIRSKIETPGIRKRKVIARGKNPLKR